VNESICTFMSCCRWVLSQRESLFSLHNRTDLWCRITLQETPHSLITYVNEKIYTFMPCCRRVLSHAWIRQ